MYLVVINVAYRTIDGETAEVSSDWAQSLHLMRDSFDGHFGELVVAAPALPRDDGLIGGQTPQRLHAQRDDIRFVALGDTRWRARNFWQHYPSIRSTCDALARQADIVHGGINNLYQPYSFVGFNAGRRAGRTTVFVQDSDAIQRLQDLTRGAPPLRRWRTAAYCRLYEYLTRRAVARADLALLKGPAVNARYRPFARNARDFYNTSYCAADIITPARLAAKCRALEAGGPLRCLSLGRLIDYKHVDEVIRAVAGARQAGARVELDIIGDGPDEGGLRALVRALAAEDIVRFCGARPYDAALLREVANYHVLLFAAKAEETPRALFDGLAGGCALLAYDIPFVQQVLTECEHGASVPRGDTTSLSRKLRAWAAEPAHVRRLCAAAAAAAAQHTAERWYARRAEWTIEAHLRGVRRTHHGRLRFQRSLGIRTGS